MDDVLRDWDRFRSTAFICHLRGHNRPRKQEDAQPFVRSYGGRQWIFAHDGDLAPDAATRIELHDDPAFEPLGRTDSERAFCWLLSRLHREGLRSLREVAPEELRDWLGILNVDGQLNMLLCDGESLAVHRDSGGAGGLCFTRRLPPHDSVSFSSPSVQIEVGAAEDANRTILVFSSTPLSPDDWEPIAGGELLIARRGAIVWRSSLSLVSNAPPRVTADAPRTRTETGEQLAAAQPMPIRQRFANAGTRLRVVHDTSYSYETDVERSSHRFLLKPVQDGAQRLVDWHLSIEPQVETIEFEDVFGNATHALELTDPYRELRVVSSATVEIAAAMSLEQRILHRRHAIPLVWMPWQRQMLSAYLLPPELPETQLRELSDFAMSVVERNDYDLVDILLDMNGTIYRDFEYVSGSTTVATTAFDVFESRRGVCQDFANLMICFARLLHLPARYRMGYILTEATTSNEIQSEASHAWVEVYVPQVGWHGLDPTNGIQVGTDHVRVACGRNYRDATPTSGTIYRGGGTETLRVAVTVEEAD